MIKLKDIISEKIIKEDETKATHLYSDIEIKAKPQPEVQKAVERFRSLPFEERKRQPLLYWLLGAGTPSYKMSKEDSDYTDKSPHKDQTCANCEYQFIETAHGHVICSQISGRIKPEGWCRLWETAEEGEDHDSTSHGAYKSKEYYSTAGVIGQSGE